MDILSILFIGSSAHISAALSADVCCLFEDQCKVVWTSLFSAKTFHSMLTAKDASCRSILI